MTDEQSTQTLILLCLGERGWAVLEREDGQRFDFPADWLPGDVAEGDVLVLRRMKVGSDCNFRLFVMRRRQEQAREAENESEAGAEKDRNPL